MPLSKEDAQRAVSILESIVTQLESSDTVENELGLSEGGLCHDLANLQSTVDVLKSPLFSALIEIRKQYEQTVEKSQTLEDGSENRADLSKETELNLDDNPDLLSQFRQRYGITNAEIHTNSSAVSSLTAEALEDDVFSPESVEATPKSTSEFPTTFVVERTYKESLRAETVREPSTKASSTRKSSKKSSSKEKSKTSSGRRLFGRKRNSSSSSGNVTLANLASSVPPNTGREMRGVTVDGVVGGEQLGRVPASSESSLSSISSEPVVPSLLLKTIQQQISCSAHPVKDPLCEAVTTESHVCEGGVGVDDGRVDCENKETVLRSNSVPGDSVPEGVPGESVTDERVPEVNVTDEGVPEESVPGDSVPEESVPGDSVPGESVTDKRVPEESVSGDSVPGESVTDEGVCDNGMPGDGTPGEGVQKKAIEETDGPRDLLFFMRDKKSQTELQNLMQTSKSREPREVTLVMGEERDGVGMDLVGVSSTGVFVSELYRGGVAHSSGQIQQGDQILRVNHRETDNMASFEIEMIIRETPPGGQLTFLVKYNPIGLTEYQRLRQH